MANFKDYQVAGFKGGEKPRLADASFYKPEVDVIIKYPDSVDERHGDIDGDHRREAMRMVKLTYPETYDNNKGILFTSDKIYIGLSPEVRDVKDFKKFEQLQVEVKKIDINDAK
eukprot:jgi/Tetstr1/444606/TSEL_032455.t1